MPTVLRTAPWTPSPLSRPSPVATQTDCAPVRSTRTRVSAGSETSLAVTVCPRGGHGHRRVRPAAHEGELAGPRAEFRQRQAKEWSEGGRRGGPREVTRFAGRTGRREHGGDNREVGVDLDRVGSGRDIGEGDVDTGAAGDSLHTAPGGAGGGSARRDQPSIDDGLGVSGDGDPQARPPAPGRPPGPVVESLGRQRPWSRPGAGRDRAVEPGIGQRRHHRATPHGGHVHRRRSLTGGHGVQEHAGSPTATMIPRPFWEATMPLAPSMVTSTVTSLAPGLASRSCSWRPASPPPATSQASATG